jgi:multidrug transporter EmrE-like cation transporter
MYQGRNMKHYLNFFFIILAIIFQTIAAVTLKYAAMNISIFNSLMPLTNPFYLLSLGFLFLQAVVWQQALIRYPLSFAYPFMSLANFSILFSSAILFREELVIANIIGLIIISIGITLLARYNGDSS